MTRPRRAEAERGVRAILDVGEQVFAADGSVEQSAQAEPALPGDVRILGGAIVRGLVSAKVGQPMAHSNAVR